jgi:hypothetical protein
MDVCRVLGSCRNRGLRDGDPLIISTGRRDTTVPVSFFWRTRWFLAGFSFRVWDDAVARGLEMVLEFRYFYKGYLGAHVDSYKE